MERRERMERGEVERMKRGRKEEREDGERMAREEVERGGREGPQGEVCEILLVVCCLRNTLVINRYVCFI